MAREFEFLRVLGEQAENWQSGNDLPVEHFLKKYDWVCDDRDQVRLLIVGERDLSRKRGRSAEGDLLNRFPEYRSELEEEFRSEIGTGGSGQERPFESQGDEGTDEGENNAGGSGQERPFEIGRYRINMGDPVGEGRWALIYKAWDPKLERFVALKVIDLARCEDKDQFDRLRSEAKMLAQLRHPNIVRVNEVIELDSDGNCFCIIIDWFDKGSLEEWIGRRGLRSVRRAAEPEWNVFPSKGRSASGRAKAALHRGAHRVSDRRQRLIAKNMVTTARAVEFVHANGIFHRDLKPANILVDGARSARRSRVSGCREKPANTLVDNVGWLFRSVSALLSRMMFANILVDGARQWIVADFGLAERAGDRDEPMNAHIVGTLRYMAPEQIKPPPGGATLARLDVYSLGAILYELLTGQHTIADEKVAAVYSATERRDTEELHRLVEKLHRLVHDNPIVSPRELDETIHPDLDAICSMALAKNPHERYSNAKELADDLDAYLRGWPVKARPLNVPARLLYWCRYDTLRAGLSAFAALLLITVFMSGWLLSIREAQRREAEAKGEAKRAVQEAALSKSEADRQRAVTKNTEYELKERTQIIDRLDLSSMNLASASAFSPEMIAHGIPMIEQRIIHLGRVPRTAHNSSRLEQSVMTQQVYLAWLLMLDGKNKKASELVTKTLAQAKQWVRDSRALRPSEKDSRQLFLTSYYVLARVHEKAGENKDALDSYLRASRVVESMSESERHDPTLVKLAASNYYNLGLFYTKLKDKEIENARKQFLKERDLVEPLFQQERDAGTKVELGQFLGMLYNEISDYDREIETFEEISNLSIVDIYNADLGEIPQRIRAGEDRSTQPGTSGEQRESPKAATKDVPKNPHLLHQLADAYQRRSKAAKARGDLNKARSDLEKSRMIVEQVLETFPDIIDLRHHQALVAIDFGELLIAMKDGRGAVESFRSASRIIKTLANLPSPSAGVAANNLHPGSSRDYLEGLERAQRSLCNVLDDLQQVGKRAMAGLAWLRSWASWTGAHPESFNAACKILDLLPWQLALKERGDVRVWADLIHCINEKIEAIVQGRYSIEARRSRVETVWALLNLAETLQQLGDKQSEDCYREAIERLEAIAKNDPVFAPRWMAEAYFDLGRLLLNRREFEAAIQPFVKAVDTWNTVLLRSRGDLDAISRRAASLLDLGAAYREAGLRDEALDSYQRSLQEYEELVKALPARTDVRYQLTELHQWVGMLLLGQGFYDKALVHFRRELDLARQLIVPEPENSSYHERIAFALAHLARCFHCMCRRGESRSFYLESIDVFRQQVTRLNGDVEAVGDLARAYFYWGKAEYESGDLQMGLTAFRRGAQQLKPLISSPTLTDDRRDLLALLYYSIGSSCIDSGDFKGAVKALQSGLEVAPKSDGMRNLLAASQLLPMALDDLKLATAQAPPVAKLLLDIRVRALIARGDLAAAVETIERFRDLSTIRKAISFEDHYTIAYLFARCASRASRRIATDKLGAVNDFLQDKCMKRAVESLDRAVTLGLDPKMLTEERPYDFIIIRQDPRYQAMLERALRTPRRRAPAGN